MNIGQEMKDLVWMNNGQVEKKARADQITDLQNKGYSIGRLSKKILTNEAQPKLKGSQLLQED